MKARPAILFLVILVVGICQGWSRQDKIKDLLEGFVFFHPMSVTNPIELELVRLRIDSKTDPQYSAFQLLLKNADKALLFKPDPPETMYIMGGYQKNSNLREMRAWLWRNSHAAYSCALAWRLTGKEKYGRKATEILITWAAKNTKFTGYDRGLQLGSHFTPMLYAFDLLDGFPGFSGAERKDFETFWRKRCLVHTAAAMDKKNNWGDNCLMGVFAAAIAFEDMDLLEKALRRLDKYFKGDWKFRKDYRGTYLPAEVKRSDGLRGITYTAYAFTGMTQSLEMARNCGDGFDFWTRQTSKGATLKNAIEDYFKWMISGKNFPWHSEPKRYGSSHRGNTFEIANTRLKLDKRISDWINDNRPIDGSQGDEYCTLLKGDLHKVDKIKGLDTNKKSAPKTH